MCFVHLEKDIFLKNYGFSFLKNLFLRYLSFKKYLTTFHEAKIICRYIIVCGQTQKNFFMKRMEKIQEKGLS